MQKPAFAGPAEVSATFCIHAMQELALIRVR
jgi:hypothetical protein